MAESGRHRTTPKVALIGFGEAGETFARAARWGGHARGWDLLAGRRAAMTACGIEAAADAGEALADAEIVLSLVTADAALNAARDYAPMLREGAMWCDMNSVSPSTKRAAAEAVQAAGARYADVAVMAPVDKGLAVPLLIAGPEAEEAHALLEALGFSSLRVVGEEVGRASAIKMIRSIMIKGLEALTWECAAAAEEAGVFDEVMASLDASERDWNWATRVAYNRERMETHGGRRAAEMEEVCRALEELGVEPVMSRGTVLRQARAAKQNGHERIEAA